ncbi:DsbA family oxidoreductase [Soonwooa purpurea]
MNQNKMKVEIWSDIMCPFCYIGKRHFEAALEHFDYKKDVEIEWKSFQLDPTIPEEVKIRTTMTDYMANRKGMNVDDVQAMFENVVSMAKDAGLDFDFDIQLLANSIKAHRIIQFAKEKNLGDQAEEVFFKAYFTEGKDLADDTTLLELSSNIGLSQDDINNALSQDEFLKYAKDDIAEAQDLGIDSVPFFVFNRKFAVKGAQPAHHFLDALKQSYADYSKESGFKTLDSNNASSCDVDGKCD